MYLTRWDPFRELRSIQERMNQAFGNALPALESEEEGEYWPAGSWAPAVDVADEGGKITVKADLPGLKKDDIKLEIRDNRLHLSGERRTESEEKKDNFYRRERTYGRFQRSFSLPASVDRTKVDARFKEGVLEIELPKREEVQPKMIEVS